MRRLYENAFSEGFLAPPIIRKHLLLTSDLDKIFLGSEIKKLTQTYLILKIALIKLASLINDYMYTHQPEKGDLRPFGTRIVKCPISDKLPLTPKYTVPVEPLMSDDIKRRLLNNKQNIVTKLRTNLEETSNNDKLKTKINEAILTEALEEAYPFSKNINEIKDPLKRKAFRVVYEALLERFLFECNRRR